MGPHPDIIFCCRDQMNLTIRFGIPEGSRFWNSFGVEKVKLDVKRVCVIACVFLRRTCVHCVVPHPQVRPQHHSSCLRSGGVSTGHSILAPLPSCGASQHVLVADGPVRFPFWALGKNSYSTVYCCTSLQFEYEMDGITRPISVVSKFRMIYIIYTDTSEGSILWRHLGVTGEVLIRGTAGVLSVNLQGIRKDIFNSSPIIAQNTAPLLHLIIYGWPGVPVEKELASQTHGYQDCPPPS